VAVASVSPDRLLVRLREGTPAVVGRIERDLVLLDLRSVEPADDDALAAALAAALDGRG
jgi:L-seryl-tRNA(Ser) seleniumtransferase